MKQCNGPNWASDWLNLGCGLRAPENWLNVDGSLQVVFARRPRLKRVLANLGLYPKSQAKILWPPNIARLDLRNPLPFPDNRFSAVYSSHTLEHLYYDQAAALIRECYRVLKSGGICRVVVPDLAATIQRYLLRTSQSDQGDTAAEQLMDELLLHPRVPECGLLGLYHRLCGYHQHKWMYDGPGVAKLLREAGFFNVAN
ncbi:MAG: class I SAM-dependent methyltransferase, partial [Gammaproteobacteria bacterium]